MTFVEFIDAQRPRLLLEYKLSQWFPDSFTPEPPNPHALLDESDLDNLKDRLIALMPRDSLIVTLWDWGVRFEQDLDDDWLAKQPQQQKALPMGTCSHSV